MQTAAKSNLFLIGYSSLKVLPDLQKASGHAEFYQQITQGLIKGIHTKEAVTRLGDRLIALAHHAYALRHMDVVEQASQALMNLPLPHQYRNLGQYYHSYNLRNNGQITEARLLLERLASEVPYKYRGEVIMSLAGLTLATGDYKSALPLYVEAGRTAHDRNWSDWITALTTQRMLAVLKSIDGNHRGALVDLENQFPLIRSISSFHPSLYYGYLNSLAVELGEVGRIEEAKNVCQIILASSFANAYPEVRETSNEIGLRGYRLSRSVVSFALRPTRQNILLLPEREPSSDSCAPDRSQQASITSLEEWKKMPKKPNGDKKDDEFELPQNPTERDIFLRIMHLATQDDISEKKLWKMLEAVEKIIAEPDED